MLKITELSKKSEDLRFRTIETLKEVKVDFNIDLREGEKIRLVFAGQYSAGKSSILTLLTGRDDIAIGGGITTQESHVYEWNGLEVIDTPGIHTELRPDHDEISYSAIKSSDMLVFVITNELFDDHIANHFRKLAIDEDKAGEMILVVNKMERAAEGNSPAQQDVVKEAIKDVIKPYTPEDLHICFLDAESYLNSLEEREDDEEYADELFEVSGYTEFIETLNNFVKEKSFSSKLTTNLYKIEAVLDKVQKLLEPKSEDKDINALEENLMQQRHTISTARYNIQREIMDIYNNAAARIRDIGLESANLLFEGCKKEDVESSLEGNISEADSIIEECQSKAIATLETRLNEIDKELSDIDNSDFSRELKSRLSGKFEGLPEGVKKALGATVEGAKGAGKAILDNAYKTGVSGGFKLTNFSGSNIHNLIVKAGHGIGYKFKPWQAVKISKGIAIGGQVLSVFGIGASIFMQLKSDSDEDEIRKTLRTNRQDIRSQFNSAASALEDHGKMLVKENVFGYLSDSIKEIDINIEEIRETRNNRNESCKVISALRSECLELIKEIHNM